MDFQVLIPWKEECQRRINETEHKEGKQYTFSSPFLRMCRSNRFGRVIQKR